MTADEAKKLVWRRGKPPHIGWWLASTDRDGRSWRWWDGKQWSMNVHDHRAARTAARRAKKPTKHTSRTIWWSPYYPANARVPRIAPIKAGRA